MNGRQGLTWGSIFGLCFGTVTALATAYSIREREIDYYTSAATKSTHIEEIVTANQSQLLDIRDKIELLERRQQWVIRAIERDTAARRVKLDPVPD
jgi:hypothetical protein